MATIYRVEKTPDGHGPYYGAVGQLLMEEPVECQGMTREQSCTDQNGRQMGAGMDGIDCCWRDDLPDGEGERPVGDALKWGTEGRFGFASPEAVDHWFYQSQRKELADLGFHVSVYDVPDADVHFGGHQVFYHSVNAKLLRTEPLENFNNGKDA